MIHFVTYDPVTGDIFGRYRSTVDESIELYAEEVGQSTVEIDEEEFASQPEKDKRVSNGELTEKDTVTISPDVFVFTADGVDECTITLTGLMAAGDLRVNSQFVHVTPGNPEVVLTSDTPQVFTLQMDDKRHQSSIVTVEAIAAGTIVGVENPTITESLTVVLLPPVIAKAESAMVTESVTVGLV